MTAGLCEWPHWTPKCCPLWLCYLLKDLADLTHYPDPVPSRCSVRLFVPVFHPHGTWTSLMLITLILKILAELTFFACLKNPNPPTSYHFEWQHMSENKLFWVASPSAVRRILFSFQSKCQTDRYVWQSKAIIHLCTVCNAAFMHGNGFLFHSNCVFWNWQQAPREVESQSKHHRRTMFALKLVATSLSHVTQARTGQPFKIFSAPSFLCALLARAYSFTQLSACRCRFFSTNCSTFNWTSHLGIYHQVRL